ncbi:hypothetical protein DFH09DRAFT_554672 [Mycena vulgaris]|nr:hypothetical protein DFH09DRAFT_554672 [Mycena vulgaris]
MTDSEWAEHPCSNCGFLRSESIQVSYPDLPASPHHLLTRNDPPSDAEAAEIRDIMAGLQSRILNIDASMARLLDILEKLRMTRKDAAELLHQSSTIRSIRCLPDDVLGEIFSQAVPDTQRHRSIVEKSPWILGRVCRRWRAVSISHPTLWSDISSDLPAGIRAAHLERSKACGLTIRLLNHRDTQAISPLLDCSSRWETAHLHIGIDMLPMLNSVRGKVPMLRELTYGGIMGGGSCTAFQIAPKLSCVTITDGAPLDLLPWPQLRRLRREGLFPSYHPLPGPSPDVNRLNQLAFARNLVELSLTGVFPKALSSVRPRPSMVELTCLRALCIDDGDFLEFFVLPVLEDICVSHRPAPIASFIDRSSCNLRKFTIQSHCPVRDLLSILDCTPSLLEIRLVALAGIDLLLAHLTIPSNAATDFRPPCPELRSLSLCNINTQHECSLVVNMMESRMDRTICSPLSLTILNLAHPRLNIRELDALEKLHARGASVEWLTSAQRARYRMESWAKEYP